MQYFQIPKKCPVCGEDTNIITNESGVKNLICTNPNCGGKIVNRLNYFCSKSGLDIKGLSKATLEKLINWGWVSNFKDILQLQKHKEEWIKKPGFGAASVNKILMNINVATHPAWLWRVIAAAGIPNIGAAASKVLAQQFKTYTAFRQAVKDHFDFTTLVDFGDIADISLKNFDYTDLDEAVSYGIQIQPEKEEEPVDSPILTDIKFAITGKLHLFKNRDELKSKIENLGGKVVGSVTKTTNYLINNDNTSQSSKNLTAIKFSIPIITEDQFLSMIHEVY